MFLCDILKKTGGIAMSVYFYKLFDLLKEKNITQKQLMERINASSSTFAKIRNNEFVSLEFIDRICEELNCDISDVVTRVPPVADITANNSKFGLLNQIARETLAWYMNCNSLSAKQISEMCEMSLNTVKDFLKGKTISTASHAKLMRLGKEYNDELGRRLESNNDTKPEKKIYCYSCGSRKNKCWAAQSVWLPEKKEYERYCAFGFDRTVDEDGNLFSTAKCPHPTTYKEFEKAQNEFEFKLKGKHKYIPAKMEEDV